ncbi:MAG: thiol:disulfide interchange protein [Chlamydiota bacterium]|jgi:protein-disulfide isomerase
MIGRKTLVLATLAVALFSLGGATLWKALQEPEFTRIETAGFPVVGVRDAEVQIVIYEDFRCVNCRIFSEWVIPKIVARFIETGRASLTIVPLAFLENSKPIANAALAVYHLAPEQFLPFAKAALERFAKEPYSRSAIFEIAYNLDHIDIQEFARSIDEGRYYPLIDQALVFAKELMGDQFGTPALFINGVRTPTHSFAAIAARVAQAERRK